MYEDYMSFNLIQGILLVSAEVMRAFIHLLLR